MYVQCNIEARSRNHCYSGKAISISCSVYVSVCYPAGKAHAPIILSSVAPLASPYFPHYLINGTIFGKKKVVEHEMYVQIFSTTFI
jgi:hypothetical protein